MPIVDSFETAPLGRTKKLVLNASGNCANSRRHSSRTIEAEREKISRLGNFLKSRDIDLIVLVARGSSDNAALFGRYLLEITTGIPVSLSAPSVHTLYGAKLKLQHALVIGVSQSGEGEDINQVLENARNCGAYTVGITNEPASSMIALC